MQFIESLGDQIDGYRFRCEHLAIDERKPGISAFMRIRNGEAFLEATIRSHIDQFDEIVAVHNQCTDRTPEILHQLQDEFGSDRLRVIHYMDRVHPPGSRGHVRTASDSPNSLVNYYNFSLAATRYQVATKLDDDHLAIGETLQEVVSSIRECDFNLTRMHCFSGLNLAWNASGVLSVPQDDPISGNGDIGFFPVREDTYFTHDRRFERFQRGTLKRQFAGFLYWHLKYLKPDYGFGNYELAQNPDSRYAKRLQFIRSDRKLLGSLSEVCKQLQPSRLHRVLSRIFEKSNLQVTRNESLRDAFSHQSIHEIVRRSVQESSLCI